MSDASDSPYSGSDPLDLSGISATDHQVAASDERTSLNRLLKQIGWGLFAVLSLVIFTILKLPEDKIRAYVQGSINEALAGQGISLSAAQSSMSLGLGLSYTMKDVTLVFPPPAENAKIEMISVTPSILALLMGKVGGTAQISNKGGTLLANFSFPANSAKGGVLTLNVDAHQLDLGSLGVVKMISGAQGGAVINGTLSVKGDMNNPSSLDGQTQLELSKIVVDAQSLLGFSIPRLAVSEGKLETVIDKGKLQLKSVRLGKTGNANDDIHATLTGDMTLARTWPQSALNAKADFSLSQNILKSLSLIDALLSPGKQPDGRYVYNLTGTLGNLTPTPSK